MPTFNLVMQAFALCLVVYLAGRLQYRLLMSLGDLIVRKLLKLPPDPPDRGF